MLINKKKEKPIIFFKTFIGLYSNNIKKFNKFEFENTFYLYNS